MQRNQTCRTSVASVVAFTGLLLAHGAAGAGFNASNNLAVYWGQNSYNQASGSLAQQPLASYCANANIDIIPMAFVVSIASGQGGQPTINFANQGNDCTGFPGTSLMKCPRIADDIIECQHKYNKTILLSIGGATYTEGGFADDSAAEAAAELVWRTFGPIQIASSTSTAPSDQHSLTSDDTGSQTQRSNSSHTHTASPTSHLSTIRANGSAMDNSTNSDSTRSSNSTLTTGHILLSTSTANTNAQYSSHHTNSTAPGGNRTTSAQSEQTSVNAASPSLTTFVTTIVRTSAETITAELGVDDLLTADRITTSAASTGAPSSSSSFSHMATTTSIATTATLQSQTLSYKATHGNLQQRQPETLRPFGNAVIDGFDFDLETSTTHFKAFALRLRALMDGDQSKPYYLTAAPQCPYPDLATDGLLNGGVPFDAVFVQFYNNYCGLGSFLHGSSAQPTFNFDAWDSWARTKSANKDVKVFLGIPAAQTAAGSGYTDLDELQRITDYCKGFGSFGGVMAWDASQAYSHVGFLRGIKNSLSGKPAV